MVGELLRNKRGWLRILEATIAVLIVTGVMIAVYSKQGNREPRFDDYLNNLGEKILLDISSDRVLRGYVLSGDNVSLISYVTTKIPPNFEFSLKLCTLGDPCKLSDDDEIQATKGKDVFSKSTIIAADSKSYNPKELKLFMWKN